MQIIRLELYYTMDETVTADSSLKPTWSHSNALWLHREAGAVEGSSIGALNAKNLMSLEKMEPFGKAGLVQVIIEEELLWEESWCNHIIHFWEQYLEEYVWVNNRFAMLKL